MLEDLKEEISKFYLDINENIKNEKEAEYIRQRTAKLIDCFASELKKIMDLNESKLEEINKKQEKNEEDIQTLNRRMENVYKDIYDDEFEEEEFLISCPYCNFEFDADIDEDFNEIRCPECGNLIELDWNGNPDDNNKENGCGGGCSQCGGCK